MSDTTEAKTSTETKPPLRLSLLSHHTDLKKMSWGNFPADLAGMLCELISSHLHEYIPPAANPRLIEMAKTHLQGGLLLMDGMGHGTTYDVAVYVPNSNEGRSFFHLIRKWPEGQMKLLSEL